ncbi:MAG: diaminopimelate epimerase [Deltaproteobacteria bacterium]|nr:diaminopimelate epimerase [Deltaproteobacteria bacterium]
MTLRFTKMHGLGNDFIVLDLRKKDLKSLPALMKKLGHRNFGIGFDQALVLKNSKKADFRMDIYNSDGSRVEMCGNGIRCLANYIWETGLSKKPVLEIETLAGIIRPRKAGKLVTVDMGEPILEGKLIPTTASGHIKKRPLKALDRTFSITCVSMGNPHCVIPVKDVDSYPVTKYGPFLETNKFFPKRTNVEFIEITNPARIKMRVWERGAGETMACGTGACGAAVAANLLGLAKRRVTMELKGGNLNIHWNEKDNRVYMTGPAVKVFDGTLEL